MKSGYLAELDARSAEIDQVRSALEGFYMQVEKTTEEEVNKNDSLKGGIEEKMAVVETILPNLQTTCKSVKLAIESWCV